MKWLLVLAVSPLLFFYGKADGYDRGFDAGHIAGIDDGRADAERDHAIHDQLTIRLGLCGYAENICPVAQRSKLAPTSKVSHDR